MEVWEEQENTVPKLPTPILDRSISYGAILQMIPVIAMFIGVMTYVLKFQFAAEQGIAEAGRFQTEYKPIIEDVRKNDVLQDMKIQQVQDAIGEIRTLARVQAEQMSTLNTSIAVIKNTLEKEKSQ